MTTTTRTKTEKEPVTLPTPERVTRTMYRVPSFSMTERAKGVAWIVTLEEMGWYCHCPYCKNHYGCKHINLLVDWLFEQDIIAALPEPSAPAKPKVRLEDLYA